MSPVKKNAPGSGVENDKGQSILGGSEALKQELICELRTERIFSQYSIQLANSVRFSYICLREWLLLAY